MFGQIFISWWYLLYILALVFRGIGLGYVGGTGEEDGFVGKLCRWTMAACVVTAFTSFKVFPWWAAVSMLQMAWVLAFAIRMVLVGVLLPLSTNAAASTICSIISFILGIISLYVVCRM